MLKGTKPGNFGRATGKTTAGTEKRAEYCRRGMRNGMKRTRRTPDKTNRSKHCGGGNHDQNCRRQAFKT